MHIKVLVDFPHPKLWTPNHILCCPWSARACLLFRIFFSRHAAQFDINILAPPLQKIPSFLTNFKIHISFSYFSSFLTICTWGATKGRYHSTHLLVVSALLASPELLWAPVEHYRNQLEQIDGGSQKVALPQTGKDAEDPVCSRYCLSNCLQLRHLRMCHQIPVVALARGRAVEDNTQLQLR